MGKRGWIGVEGAEAQHVDEGDGLCGRSQNVSNDATHASVGSAEGLYGTRMIVGLHLHRHRLTRAEFHDPCIAHEGRHHPWCGNGRGGGLQLA